MNERLALLALLASCGAEPITQQQQQRAPLVAHPGVFDADAYIPPGGDLADAIWAIQTTPGCDGPGKRGCEIRIPRGDYYIDKPVVLCRSVHLHGVGSGGSQAGAAVAVFSSTTAIRVASSDECATALGADDCRNPNGTITGACPGGDWSIIERVRLRGEHQGRGIDMQARATLRDLSVDWFDVGIYVRGETTNANVWRIDNVVVTRSARDNVLINGPDSNAGLATALDSSLGCYLGQGSALAGTECANVHDSSFLGNTFVAGHSAHPLGGGNQWWVDDPNARSSFLGTYAEWGSGGNNMGSKGVVAGGIALWDKEAVGLFLGHTINGLCIMDPSPAGNPNKARICFGRRSGDALMNMEALDFGAHFTFKLKAVLRGDRPVWSFAPNNWVLGLMDMQIRDDRPSPRSGTLTMYAPTLLLPCDGSQTTLGAGVGVMLVGGGLALCAE